MKSILAICAAACVMFAAGCATATASKISDVKIGMSKSEVILIMGKPTSTSAQGKDIEYLNYALSETDDDAYWGTTKPYCVRLIKGRVESFGRLEDFNTTTVRLLTGEK